MLLDVFLCVCRMTQRTGWIVRKRAGCRSVFFPLSEHAHLFQLSSSHTATIWAQIAPAVSQRGTLHCQCRKTLEIHVILPLRREARLLLVPDCVWNHLVSLHPFRVSSGPKDMLQHSHECPSNLARSKKKDRAIIFANHFFTFSVYDQPWQCKNPIIPSFQ